MGDMSVSMGCIGSTHKLPLNEDWKSMGSTGKAIKVRLTIFFLYIGTWYTLNIPSLIKPFTISIGGQGHVIYGMSWVYTRLPQYMQPNTIFTIQHIHA